MESLEAKVERLSRELESAKRELTLANSWPKWFKWTLGFEPGFAMYVMFTKAGSYNGVGFDPKGEHIPSKWDAGILTGSGSWVQLEKAPIRWYTNSQKTTAWVYTDEGGTCFWKDHPDGIKANDPEKWSNHNAITHEQFDLIVESFQVESFQVEPIQVEPIRYYKETRKELDPALWTYHSSGNKFYGGYVNYVATPATDPEHMTSHAKITKEEFDALLLDYTPRYYRSVDRSMAFSHTAKGDKYFSKYKKDGCNEPTDVKKILCSKGEFDLLCRIYNLEDVT